MKSVITQMQTQYTISVFQLCRGQKLAFQTDLRWCSWCGTLTWWQEEIMTFTYMSAALCIWDFWWVKTLQQSHRLSAHVLLSSSSPTLCWDFLRLGFPFTAACCT